MIFVIILVIMAIFFAVMFNVSAPKRTGPQRRWRSNNSWYLDYGDKTLGICYSEDEEKRIIEAYEKFREDNQ